MQEENVLAKFAKGPFSKFKEGGLVGILEEILGRLRVLRRNQCILIQSDQGCGRLFEEYQFHVVHINDVKTDHTFIVTMLDAIDSWTTEYNSCVVTAKLQEDTLEEYQKAVVVANARGYISIALSNDVVVFIRKDLTNDVGIRGINLRNFDLIFFDR
jgi:hypothetical protein